MRPDDVIEVDLLLGACSRLLQVVVGPVYVHCELVAGRYDCLPIGVGGKSFVGEVDGPVRS